MVVLSRVFVTQTSFFQKPFKSDITSKLFVEACISPACKNFVEVAEKKRFVSILRSFWSQIGTPTPLQISAETGEKQQP